MSEVVTGDAVVLEVPCAQFPSRLLALAIDIVIQFVLLVAGSALVSAGSAGGVLNPAWSVALAVTVLVAVVVGYPVTWETLTRGRSPGKFALGLRVVSDDGGPERFRQALVRGFASIVEVWSGVGLPIALVTMMLSARGKRLGDIFAGTFVLQQRLPAHRPLLTQPAPWPYLAQWAASLEFSALSEQTAEMARRYLARAAGMDPTARAGLAERIAGMVSAQVSPPPPPGTAPEHYLNAVLAERRRREQIRLGYVPSALPGPTPAPDHPAAPRPAAPSPREDSAQSQPQRPPPAGTPTRTAGGFVPPS